MRIHSKIPPYIVVLLIYISPGYSWALSQRTLSNDAFRVLCVIDLALYPYRRPESLAQIRQPAMAPFYSQHHLTLPLLNRGSHLITDHITSSLQSELRGVKVGLLHLFVQHTSCALSMNENWDQDVRADMSDALDKIVVEDKRKCGFLTSS